ncbi:MAG: DUF2793 domain-containing protein [Alphaproteobacteria bacterium]
MSYTSNLKLPLLKSNQPQKELLINESFIALDALIGKGAISRVLTTPPINPNIGDLYIIANKAKDVWSEKEGYLACFISDWKYIEPHEGMQIWVNNEAKQYIYTEGHWVSNNDILKEIPALAIGCRADPNHKLAVKADSILFDAVEDGPRIYINKKADNGFASFLFQSDYMGKAEFGLTGEDDFALKVSKDGKDFHESFIVDSRNGNFILKGNVIGVEQAISVNVERKYKIDLEAASIFEIETYNKIEIQFPSRVSKNGASFTIIVKGENVKLIDWPGNVTWMSCKESVIESEVVAFKFLTCNGGKSWYGFILGNKPM